jgi:hypothetical protein
MAPERIIEQLVFSSKNPMKLSIVIVFFYIFSLANNKAILKILIGKREKTK